MFYEKVNEIGTTITATRINKFLSKQDVCKELNITYEDLTKIEAGILEDDLVLNKVMNYLGIV